MRTRPKALPPVVVIIIIICALVCLGAEVPRPRPGTFVHDFAGVIPDEREAELQAKAVRLRDEFRTEVALVIVETLGGEESFDYSMRMARAWGIGAAEDDSRGLLILVAVKDRKTAFRTSRHVEGELPDGVTGEISREMNTYFKRGDFGGGLSIGMDKILGRMREVYEAPTAVAAAPAPARGFGMKWLLPFMALPVLGAGYVLWRRRARKKAEVVQHSRSGFREWAATKDPSAKPPRPNRKSQEITRAGAKKKNKNAPGGVGYAPTFGHDSSSYESPSYTSSSSSDSSSSSSYDSGSSSGSDSGSSYGGSSDFGGGGSDSSW